MSLNTNDVLDLTKENIQPLRHGRKAAQLKTALQAQIDPETQQKLHKQREQYENMIRMYEGDDPLSPYYEFIIWLEQSYPKMGRESNLMPVIEETIIKFKDHKKYMQDQRFVKIMIKYISAQSNALELYQEVYGRGLGSMCSILFKAWAEELDKHNDIKRANQVFQIGISCRAQPLEELVEAHIQFQLSIARRMLEGNMNEPVEDSGRNALSKLSSAKLKTNRSSKDSAGVFQFVNRAETGKELNSATPKFKVFEEDVENDDGIRNYKSKNDKLPRGSIADRENVMKASKWRGQKQKQAWKMPSTPATPSFPIHEDPDAECKTKFSVLRPRALKMKREDFDCPVAVFEPVDPTKVPMYPKQQVYVGGHDVQLEEIRAAYYWKKIKNMEDEKRVPEQNVDMDVTEEPVDLTKSSNTSADQRPDAFAQNTDYPSVSTSVTFNSNAELCNPQPLSSTANSFILEPSVVPNFVKPVSQKPLVENRFSSLAVSRRSDAFLLRSNLNSRKSEYMDVISQKELLGRNNFDVDSSNTENHQETRVNEKTALKVSDVESHDQNSAAQPDKCDSFGKLHKIEDNLNDFRFCDRNNLSAFHHSPSTSITINTRAAMNVIQKMWESPLAVKVPGNQANDDNFCQSVFKMPMQHKSKKVCQPLFSEAENRAYGDFKPFTPFEVFADETAVQLEPKKSNPAGLPFPVYIDRSITVDSAVEPLAAQQPAAKSAKLPFPIFDENGAERRSLAANGAADDRGDLFDIPLAKPKITANYVPLDEEELARPMGTLCMNEAEQQTPLPLIVPVNLRDTPLEPENKENRPPKDYQTPSERRPLSGILTPATDIQVKEPNSDDSDDDDNYWQMHGRDNDFDESCNTRAFAIRLPSSTPSTRPEYSRAARRFSVYNGSYISEEVAAESSATKQASSVTAATNSQVAASSKNTVSLSLILENSKEQGSSSSSGHSAHVVSKYNV